MKRIASLDYCRAVAIVGIILAHFFLVGPSTFVLGKWLASTFNAVFLAVSAFLAGLKWNESGRPVLGIQFLTRRFFRLAVPLWFFLTAFFLYAGLSGFPIPHFKVLLNYAFLAWFAKIPGIGHLWFVTMIGMLYFSYCGISLFIRKEWGRRVLVPALFVLCTGLFILLHHWGLPAYMAVYLLVCCLLFLYADKCRVWYTHCPKPWILALIIVFMGGTLGYFLCYHLFSDETLPAILGILTGVSIVLLFLAVSRKWEKTPAWVAWIAGISYELYLVHHPLIIGPFALGGIDNRWLLFGVYLLCSAALAVLLQWLSGLIYKRLRK